MREDITLQRSRQDGVAWTVTDLRQLVAVVLADQDLLYAGVPAAEHVDALRGVRIKPHLIADDTAQAGYSLAQVHLLPIQVDGIFT